MARKVKSLLVSRLIVLITAILIPIAIFVIFISVNFDLWFSESQTLEFWIIKVLCPVIFAASWLYFMILFRNRIALTIDSMERVTSIIPLRLKIFYGMIALFVLFIFIFPLITPFVSILSFMSIAWQISTRTHEFDASGKSPWYTKILMILFVIVPIFCTVAIIPEYVLLSNFISASIWEPLIEHIYTISYCLCTALAVGSLFFLFGNKGVSEYEQILTHPDEKKGNTYIKYVEVILFLFLLILAYTGFELIEFFYGAGLVIVVFVSIVNFFSSKSKTGKFRGHILGYLLAAIFMGSNLLIFNIEFGAIFQIISLVVLAGVFIVVFIITFIVLEEEDEF
ncbi:MAG: conserved membrane protein of unknown function [Promethearchaeota archaeon]|nr:MAG: conserved membrane protein of unknown function [Candidatus Lokiarchaeota archaeon]